MPLQIDATPLCIVYEDGNLGTRKKVILHSSLFDDEVLANHGDEKDKAHKSNRKSKAISKRGDLAKAYQDLLEKKRIIDCLICWTVTIIAVRKMSLINPRKKRKRRRMKIVQSNLVIISL